MKKPVFPEIGEEGRYHFLRLWTEPANVLPFRLHLCPIYACVNKANIAPQASTALSSKGIQYRNNISLNLLVLPYKEGVPALCWFELLRTFFIDLWPRSHKSLGSSDSYHLCFQRISSSHQISVIWQPSWTAFSADGFVFSSWLPTKQERVLKIRTDRPKQFGSKYLSELKGYVLTFVMSMSGFLSFFPDCFAVHFFPKISDGLYCNTEG